ncbi:MAG TPA: arginine--tRNA ligase [archaeon]|nr:arginine--tRNA ligase [archaeon]
MVVEKEVVKALESAGLEDAEKLIEVPPQPELGDLALPCFELAKKDKMSPAQIAEEFSKKIKIPKGGTISRIETKAGYVNFFLNWEKIAESILKQIGKGLKVDSGKRKKIMVEYSQPNPVHPMHIGHSRGTFLGDALAKILEFVNFKVVKANYMNDTGLQVAKLVTAYELWAKGKTPEGKPDLWLWELYVKFHEEAGKDSALEDKARETLRKFELEKDPATLKQWNQIVKWCVEGFEQTYKKLGISFDDYLYENNFRADGKKNVEKLISKGYANKNEEGAVVTDLEKFGLTNTIILRSDGTGLYHTSDLGMTPYKFEKYKLDRAIWVVSSEQNLYFKQLFKMLELLDYKWFENCHHFSFELVRLPEGKMSSREGRAVMLDEVVSKLVQLAYDEINKRNLNLEDSEKRSIAEKVGIGALKYAIVKIEPARMITFDWNRMLSLEGDTGPYLQYAHTRCAGIIKKAGEWKPNFKTEKLMGQEEVLIKLLANFSNIIENAAKDLRPHYICNYAFDLATALDKFYEACPVLKAKNENLKNFRLTLVDSVKTILKIALNLVGIEALEKM